MKDDKPGRKILDLREYAAIDGRPVFDTATIDPETGDLLDVKLAQGTQTRLKAREAEMQQAAIDVLSGKGPKADQARAALQEARRISAQAKEAIKTITRNPLNAATREGLRKVVKALDELAELEPYLEAELQKPEYNGVTLDDLLKQYEPRELPDLPEDSILYKALQAARSARDTGQAMKEGREKRREEREKAQEANAIMEIKGGHLHAFSNINLWDAFNPSRICKMGKLDPEFIDKETGEIKKYDLREGEEILPLDALEIPLRALMLLNAVLGNSVDNVFNDFIESGQITFYVKGVLQAFTDDPRTLLDNQLNMDRKTAGAIYLEQQFEPLQGYIGTTDTGARYTIFSYYGYDPVTDTMTVATPYLYQLWKSTQEAYFDRKQRQIEARAEDKRPKHDDFKPLEINRLFKGRAYSVDEIILEIAIYITNVLLAAGGKGKLKRAEISYKKLIENCPRFKMRLQEIEARPGTTPDGKEINKTALYNTELRKIKRAFDLIYDPDKCDALKYFDFNDIQPGKINKAGKFEFIAPTKKKINEKIYIEWTKKRDILPD